MKELKCKRCGRILSSNDYLADCYGFCEGECEDE